jgi:hypothetical protein
MFGSAQGTRRGDIRHPQLGSVPRHLRMSPCEPCQPRSVWTDARRRVEVVARGDHLPGALAAIERNGDERRLRLARCVVSGLLGRRSRISGEGGSWTVILAYADQPVAFRVEGEIGVEPAKGSALDIPAEPLAGRQRCLAALRAARTAMRSTQRVQNSRFGPHSGPIACRGDRSPGSVHALIGEIREIDLPTGDDVCAAAVLVHARAQVEAGRRQLLVLPIGAAAHQRAPAAFVRPPFEPIDVVGGDGDTAEPDALCRHCVRGNRRRPCSVWSLHPPTVQSRPSKTVLESP